MQKEILRVLAGAAILVACTNPTASDVDTSQELITSTPDNSEAQAAYLISEFGRQALEVGSIESVDRLCMETAIRGLNKVELDTLFQSVISDSDLGPTFDPFVQSIGICYTESPPSTNSSLTSAANSFFLIDRPFPVDVCIKTDRPLCYTGLPPVFTEGLVKMGYRIPSPEGLPSSFNRNTSMWTSLTERQKNDYLTTTLWNFAAKLGVVDGAQTRDDSQISAEYTYMLELTNWIVKNLKAGFAPVPILDEMRSQMRSKGDQDRLIDWRINAAIHVALPVIAPEYITLVDRVIQYRD